MADQIIDVQLKFSGGVKTPIVTGSRRLTLLNLAKLIWSMAHGSLYKQNAGYIQVQPTLVAASATATPVAVAGADTLTIAGTALTATQKRASGTITCATALAAQTITVNGQTFTAVAGAAVPGEATFSIDTGDTETAASIATQVNAYGGSLVSGIVGAKSAAGVVTLYAITQGTAGNSITLASSDAGTLLTSGVVLANGAALSNNTFDFAGSDVTTGAAIAYAINNSSTAAIQQVTATSNSSTGVVTVTAKVAGVAGNAITFVSSDGTRLAVTGSGFLASGSAGAVTRWPAS